MGSGASGPLTSLLLLLGAILVGLVVAALLQEQLSELLQGAARTLTTIALRLRFRTAAWVSRRMRRFWLARQYEPVRSITSAIDRLIKALPHTGSAERIAATRLRDSVVAQLQRLKTLGIQAQHDADPPAARTPSPDPPPSPTLLYVGVLIVLAVLVGAANSFLLKEFFQGFFPQRPVFPIALPDFQLAHVFALLIAVIELATGVALHHFASEEKAEANFNFTSRVLRLAPWIALAALVTLEAFAYSLLSAQIDLPRLLKIDAASGMYDLAKYFLAGLGIAMTMMLTALGHAISSTFARRKVARDAVERVNRRHTLAEALLESKEQLKAATDTLAELQLASATFEERGIGSFTLAFPSVTAARDLGGLVLGHVALVLGSAATIDGAVERLRLLTTTAERAPVRTRAQVIADLAVYSLGGVLLAAVAASTIVYLGGAVDRTAQQGSLTSYSGLVTASIVLGVLIASGFYMREMLNGARHATIGGELTRTDLSRRVGTTAVVSLVLIASAVLAGIAIRSAALGSSVALNLAFGLFHAAALTFLGSAIDSELVAIWHVTSLILPRLALLAIWVLVILLLVVAGVLRVFDWTLRVVAVFGALLLGRRATSTP